MGFKSGDLVMIVRLHPDSHAAKAGLEPGHIGTFRSWFTLQDDNPCTQELDCVVDFRSVDAVWCPSRNLRLIPPHEPGDWQHCVWKPKALIYEAERLLAGSL